MDSPPEGVVTVTADVTDEETVKGAFEEIKKRTRTVCLDTLYIYLSLIANPIIIHNRLEPVLSS